MSDQQVVANQKKILSHQASILKNQKSILANQAVIKKNQGSRRIQNIWSASVPSGLPPNPGFRVVEDSS